ncbi:hypothetical protein N8560_00250 [bacterium]|nr:hypothetical protein [bacterium]
MESLPLEAYSSSQDVSIFYDFSNLKLFIFGGEYLQAIFTHAIGHVDLEHPQDTTFVACSLLMPYHSLNTDPNRRICHL